MKYYASAYQQTSAISIPTPLIRTRFPSHFAAAPNRLHQTLAAFSKSLQPPLQPGSASISWAQQPASITRHLRLCQRSLHTPVTLMCAVSRHLPEHLYHTWSHFNYHPTPCFSFHLFHISPSLPYSSCSSFNSSLLSLVFSISLDVKAAAQWS